jgi:hypothetical protein
MTVLTMPAAAGHAPARRPVPWRNMLWVTWRQHRATVISVAAVLAVIAVLLVVFDLQVRHDYASVVNCSLNEGNRSAACSAAFSHFNSADWPLGNTVGILVSLLPALIGAFAGAPLLARELETGTFRYAWTQGFGRERQAIAKLALVGSVLAVLAGAFGAVFTWFFQPFLYPEQLNVLTETVFATHWLVFGAFTLVAFTVGAFLGMLFRRIIPAMAATLGVYLVIRLVAWGVRKYYPVSVVTSNAKLFNAFETPGTPGYPWILSSWFTGPGGKLVSQSVVNKFPVTSNSGSLAGAYQLPPGYTEWTRYIPFSHFWPMQFIEAGWLLILALAFGAATVALVCRRAA